MSFENPGLRPREILCKPYNEMADILFNRLETLQTQVSGLVKTDWEREFVSKCEAEHANRLEQWDSDWITLCDGKNSSVIYTSDMVSR